MPVDAPQMSGKRKSTLASAAPTAEQIEREKAAAAFVSTLASNLGAQSEEIVRKLWPAKVL